jgi:dTMP kinase
MNGQFITIEGTEGVGKTTQNEAIQTWMNNKGIDYIVTREPGGTQIGEKIRALLLDKTNKAMGSDAELLLMFAARSEHVEKKIQPALAKGQWVLCDRFVDSSFAYQGFGRGLGVERIKQLEQWTLGSLKPNKTFLLKMDIAQGLQRAAARADLDRFEEEKLDFYNKVEKGYLYRAEHDPDRFSIIDASQTIEKVTQDIESELETLYRG